ncbi:MAG: M48 family metallopeptidase [Burkholderiales bacterium]
MQYALIQRFGRTLALAAAVAATACTTVQTTQPGAIGVTRTQRMAISAEQIDAAADKSYDQMLSEARTKGKLNQDSQMVARVRRISQRLIAQVGSFRPDALQWKWEINLFQSDDVNAFCMAGGKIGVYSGLITKLDLTDDELAAVLGHEIAHALREHVREQVSAQYAQQIPLLVLGAVTGSDALTQLGGMVTQVTLGLPRSRQAEREADDIGVELAARAGYDPRAAIGLWQKMEKLGGAKGPEFLSTHPSNASRQQDLAEAAQVVMPLYQRGGR